MNSSENERRNRIADMALEKFLDQILDGLCKWAFTRDDAMKSIDGAIVIAYGIADKHIAAGNKAVSDDGSDA